MSFVNNKLFHARRRYLLVGAGDIARRVLPLLCPQAEVFALVRRDSQAAWWRAQGVRPIQADLSQRTSLTRCTGMDVILHFAPPPASGNHDTYTRNLLAALGKSPILPRDWVYISTSGVYGDYAGAYIDETARVQPASARACRRLDAEQQLRTFARRRGIRLCILRVPGIYAQERSPLARIQAQVPAILAAEDSFSNHIHADDLAASVIATLRWGKPGRVYHVCDDAQWKMGEWFDVVADAAGIARVPRLPRAEVKQRVSPMLWSFLAESRRLSNQRLKQELHYQLHYPTAREFFATQHHTDDSL